MPGHGPLVEPWPAALDDERRYFLKLSHGHQRLAGARRGSAARGGRRRRRRSGTNGACSTSTTRATRPPPTRNTNGILDPDRTNVEDCADEPCSHYRLCSRRSRPPPRRNRRRRLIHGPICRIQLFKDAPIVEDATFASLEAPPRAEDAALTPVDDVVHIHAPNGDARRVVKLSLVIDENPVPLAGEFTLGAEVGRRADRDPGARRRLHQHAPHRRTQRRQPAHDEDLCEGGGRLFGAGDEEPRPGQRRTRQDETAGDRRRRPGPRRFRRHAAPSQQFRAADGSGHAALYAGALRRSSRDLPGRRSWSSRSKAEFRSRRTRTSASTSRATTPRPCASRRATSTTTHFQGVRWPLRVAAASVNAARSEATHLRLGLRAAQRREIVAWRAWWR